MSTDPSPSKLTNATLNRMADTDRLGLYRTIFSRRDVRSQFVNTPVADSVLARVLTAAHHAPSVGLMQPWNFIVLRSREKRTAVQALFEAANAEAADLHEGERGKKISLPQTGRYSRKPTEHLHYLQS